MGLLGTIIMCVQIVPPPHISGPYTRYGSRNGQFPTFIYTSQIQLGLSSGSQDNTGTGLE